MIDVRPSPFPHAVIDDWWNEDLLDSVRDEFPDVSDSRWRRYENSQERKSEGREPMWGPRTRELIDSMAEKAPELEAAFGIPDLIMETAGGGYHLIEPGGYLAMHTDFNVSPRSGLYRRLNMLVYLNDDWIDEGGCLELWNDDGPEVIIAPEFNRTVIFETSDRSWHGHPKPTPRVRRSVAAYFYSPEPPASYTGGHSTVWHPNA